MIETATAESAAKSAVASGAVEVVASPYSAAVARHPCRRRSLRNARTGCSFCTNYSREEASPLGPCLSSGSCLDCP